MDGILDPQQASPKAQGGAVSVGRVEAEAEAAVRTLLAYAGEDPTREGLIDTPARVLRAYGAVLFRLRRRRRRNPVARPSRRSAATRTSSWSRTSPSIRIASTTWCRSSARSHIAYLPHEGVVGLSKLARLTDAFARRFQTQENLTAQIVDALNEHLNPRGVAVMLEAEHMCMTMRGVQAHGALTVTQRFTGVFAEEGPERRRFFELIRDR